MPKRAPRTSRSQRVLRALGSPVRREILWRIWERELPVAAICEGFRLSAPTISEHLAVLREAGLVELRPEGTTRWYRANRSAIQALRGLIPDDASKWEPQPIFPEEALATSIVTNAVVTFTEAACDPASAFRAFTDARLFSAWLGVPVQLAGVHFACTMAWGTRVRGTLEVLAPGVLIAMHWDFQDGDLPLPGGVYRATLAITPCAAGARLEVVQVVSGADQAAYMQRAWRFVLGRFHDRIASALETA